MWRFILENDEERRKLVFREKNIKSQIVDN